SVEDVEELLDAEEEEVGLAVEQPALVEDAAVDLQEAAPLRVRQPVEELALVVAHGEEAERVVVDHPEEGEFHAAERLLLDRGDDLALALLSLRPQLLLGGDRIVTFLGA